ncbi:MAG: prephenate dehydratase domain-containing protein, partial [SAR324 cluster bacterium]|nr:prephenate dehydratase domain-containing protein [SAR324 cluster bacterium]
AEAHLVLLPQAAIFLEKNGIRGVRVVDSAGAAAALVKSERKGVGVLASKLAAEIYGLDILAENIEDLNHNTTRFLLLSPNLDKTRRGNTQMMTTFIFQVRNIPAALYKALGSFATNGVNMTKLESYMVGGSFSATQFYADIEGHPDDKNVKLALDELAYFTQSISILGVYPADSKRAQSN